MNKNILAMVFATLLLLGGVSNLLAETLDSPIENSRDTVVLPASILDSPLTLSGIGNGGGNPG
ncbi:MAG: hypothetical protein HXS41_06630 [Theionarchaea archaeon]|nr:hypothetical protein [Theionarchaea archaeon]MBU7020716.1 hypothetical protein [Theionarchaea archaeon]MBU7036129.1 hypothetical protein [Theionarchaea archaeon]